MNASDSIIELANVSKQFGDVRAVDGVSFSIKRGEFFSLLGPSGCGKTTLLRILAGFEHPSSGDVLIDGRMVFSKHRDGRFPAPGEVARAIREPR